MSKNLNEMLKTLKSELKETSKVNESEGYTSLKEFIQDIVYPSIDDLFSQWSDEEENLNLDELESAIKKAIDQIYKKSK